MCSAEFVFGILEYRRDNFEAAEVHFMEAQNMWFHGGQTRLYPFNAGCMYKTGVVCLDQGKHRENGKDCLRCRRYEFAVF